LKIAITQPNYLPWLGYFDLLQTVDILVFLDNVQLVRRSFIVRNRIKTNNNEVKWLTVSLKSCPQRTLINQAVIDDSNWCEAHLNKIDTYYRSSKYYKQYIDFLQRLILPQPEDKFLSRYNKRVILELCSVLGIKTEIIDSSSLLEDLTGTAEGKILRLCNMLKPKELYTFSKGVEVGLYKGENFKKIGVDLFKHEYHHPIYNQVGSTFIPYLSIIDLLFNEGDNSFDRIKEGTKWIKVN